VFEFISMKFALLGAPLLVQTKEDDSLGAKLGLYGEWSITSLPIFANVTFIKFAACG
jgi:hypothetical protein